MAATPIPFATKDNASGRLNAGITASTLSIPLQSGNGANFPQPYSGATTSGGSSTTLNCTGISATIGGSAQEGKWIWNKTDGSVCRIVTVSTNSLTTTRLLGGTDNTWDSGDTWCIDPFVVTFAVVSTSAYGVESITTSEEALITGRSTDTLTVPSGGRGYNGTVASSFSSGDYVYLFVTSPIVERLKDIASTLAVQVNTNVTDIATANTNIGTLRDGTYHYVVATGSANAYVAASPTLSSYTAGNIIVFKANFTNSGSATLNVNGLGAKTIKKLDGATNLAAGDIQNGQIVVVRYDGTNLQMVSPLGQASSLLTNVGVVTAASTGVGSASTGENTMSPTWTGSANVGSSKFAAAGSWAHVRLSGGYRLDSGTLTIRVKAGSTLLAFIEASSATTGTDAWAVDLHVVCRTAGASGVLIAGGRGTFGTQNFWTASADGTSAPTTATGAFDLTASQTLTVTAQFSASDADHTATIDSGTITMYATP